MSTPAPALKKRHPHRRSPFAQGDKKQQLIQLAAVRVSHKQLVGTFLTPQRTVAEHLARNASRIRQLRRDFLLQFGASIGLTLPEIARLTALPLADVRLRLTELLKAEETAPGGGDAVERDAEAGAAALDLDALEAMGANQ